MGISPTRIAILGGGVAGCVLARRLGSMPHVSVDLIERDHRLGGLHRSVRIDDATYDIGAYVFGSGHPFFSIFPGLSDLFVEIEHLPATITPAGAVHRFPFSPREYFEERGPLHAARVAAELIAAKARHRQRSTLPDFMRYYLGETLYRDSGLRSYIERFYMASEESIDLDFARQRLATMTRSASLRWSLWRSLRRIIGGPRVEPWHCYVRPPEGFDAAYRHIEEDLRVLGVNLRLGCSVEAISRVGEETLVSASGRADCYDRVISTLPLMTTAACLGIEAGADPAIEHMSLLSLFYRFDGTIDAPGHFLYNFTFDGEWKRLVLFSRYYGSIDGEHYFTVECTRRPGEEDLESAARDFERHAARLPLFNGGPRYVGGLVTPNAYPLFRPGYRGRVEQLRSAIAERGIEIAGRQGTFRYLSSHQVAEEARELASRLELPARRQS